MTKKNSLCKWIDLSELIMKSTSSKKVVHKHALKERKT